MRLSLVCIVLSSHGHSSDLTEMKLQSGLGLLWDVNVAWFYLSLYGCIASFINGFWGVLQNLTWNFSCITMIILQIKIHLSQYRTTLFWNWI